MKAILHFVPLLIPVLLLAVSAGVARADEPARLPPRLSQTGLFIAGSTDRIRPGLLSFSPQYPLWSDGTRKRRWIELPPGAQIDASDPNAWEFPGGTRLFKEFSLGRRIETRVIERASDGSWNYGVYVWLEDGSDALLAPPAGVPPLSVAGASGGRYVVPSEYDCRACHEGTAVPVLGFSALQLSADRDPLAPHADASNPADLPELVRRGWLRNLPQALLDSPPRIAAGSAMERAALGYLHANCGHCHGSPGAADAAVPVNLRLAQDAVDAAASTAVRSSLIGKPSRFQPAGAAGSARLMVPGQADGSVLYQRMRSRDPRTQMPPLGTSLPDAEALTLIGRWIDEHPRLETPH